MMLWQYCVYITILRSYKIDKIDHKNVFMRLDLLKRENYIDIIMLKLLTCFDYNQLILFSVKCLARHSSLSLCVRYYEISCIMCF